MADETVVPGSEPNPQGSGEPQNTETVETLQKRLRDMQSMKDRAEAQLRQVAPIIEQIRTRPEVLEVLRGERPRQIPVQPAVDGSLAMPTKPERPDGYDEHSAYNDPSSESWKYRKSYDRYREQMDEFLLNRERQREAEERKRQMAQQQMAEVNTVMSHLRNHAISKGRSEAEAIDFVNFISDDENFRDEDTMLVIYDAVKEFRSGKRRVNTQTPVTPANLGPAPDGSGSPKAYNSSEPEGRSFNEGLLAHRRRSKFG